MLRVLICTSNCGYGDGVFHTDDLKYVFCREKLDIKIARLNNFPFCSTQTKEGFFSDYINSDLVIFPFHSSAFLQFIDKFTKDEYKKFFRHKAKKVLWTLDNHLFFKEDVLARKMVDMLYVAHINYISHLKESDFKHLPSAYYLTGIDEYMQDLSKKTIHRYDLFVNFRYFKHHLHSNQRIQVVFNIAKIIKENFSNLNILFASVPNGKNYIDAIKSSNVVLNVSMLDDFNIRNFEAIAFNKPLLASRTSAHFFTQKNYDLDFSNTFLFNRDCSDFHICLSNALHAESKKTFSSILNKNMLVHRYIKIINDMLCIDCCVRDFSWFTLEEISCSKLNNFSIEYNYDLNCIAIMHAYDLISNGEISAAKQVLSDALSFNC